jgi:hypothetical protein
MPTWGEILKQIQARRTPQGGFDLDGIRREYLAALAKHTGRPVILYATNWTSPGVDPQLTSIPLVVPDVERPAGLVERLPPRAEVDHAVVLGLGEREDRGGDRDADAAKYRQDAHAKLKLDVAVGAPTPERRAGHRHVRIGGVRGSQRLLPTVLRAERGTRVRAR